jgi:hypothetical protein
MATSPRLHDSALRLRPSDSPVVVEIAPSDVGFESNGYSEWTPA